MIPGEYVLGEGDIEANVGRRTVQVTVANTGDRPIQVGSHFHFFEANRELAFDRAQAFGMRLNIPAGTAVRFEPGDEKMVTLVELAGAREVHGLNALTDGPTGDGARAAALERAARGGFKGAGRMSLRIPRRQYADLYGPTVGDRVRLADTELLIEVERDFTVYGDEVKFGGGKVIRDGMGQSARAVSADGVLDLVITNALILDHWGIVKADIGVRGGRIVGVGKAGNPDIMAGITPGMVIGASTEVIAGEGRIVTAGGIDSHIHFICPQLVDEALAAGLTTLIGGGTGPATGTNATTCASGAWNIHRMLEAAEGLPINLGLPRQGQRVAAGAAARAGGGGRHRAEAARGLGDHAGRHRRLPRRGRGDGHAGRDPHRHAERGGLRGDVHPRLQGTDHPHVSHGRRRGRARARHPARVRRGELPAVVHQSHHALHREHHGRASRHAHGVPSPQRRRFPRTWPSRSRASAPRPSPPRTCCTTWAPSACCRPTRRPWGASPRSSRGPGRPPTR